MAVNEKGFCSEELATKQFLRAEIAELRVEMHGEFGRVCNEIHAMALDIDGRLRQMTMWTAGAVITSASLTTTISALMR